ncbi:hypothetical protein [Pseudomonas fluorescens]|uniref:hypothetical protein n=1 Tax=Pseudomonas fluorescens TaxID=294 RepID=UPI00069B984C|nr:hypothetical protein [Pseudomonas fluorescens]
MNRHFLPLDGVDNDPVPSHAYGRFDHIELDAGGNALVAFDLVKAHWIKRMGIENELFSLEGSPGQAQLWRLFYERQQKERLPNPFESMNVYRLEIELRNDEEWFGMAAPGDGEGLDHRLAAMEEHWVDFQITEARIGDSGEQGTRGHLYRRMFNEPSSVIVNGALVTAPVARSLSTIFSLSHLPRIDQNDFEQLLSREVLAEWLGVFDVGQGNACALLEESVQGVSAPRLYFDLGAGVYRNQHTTPADLEFGFYSSPPVVLSHWDSDHWAGAYIADVFGEYPALKLKWIAPLQTVGPTHIAFANDVRKARGEFLIYSPQGSQSVGKAQLGDGRILRFMRGSGYDRNNSGLVMTIEDQHAPIARSWILTGDCDYKHFMTGLAPKGTIALIAPHHGATLSSNNEIPKPNGPYRRLIYSFGKGNKHGSTHVTHPTSDGVLAHSAKDWVHDAWKLNDPGFPLAEGDVRSTCEHYPGTQRGGILVGWVEPQAQILVMRTFKSAITSTNQT